MKLRSVFIKVGIYYLFSPVDIFAVPGFPSKAQRFSVRLYSVNEIFHWSFQR